MGGGRGKGAMTTLLFVEGGKKIETHVFFLTFLILIFKKTFFSYFTC